MESQSETIQTMSALKLPMLKTGDYDLWSMRIEKYLTHTNYALLELIMNSDAPASIASVSGGVEAALHLKTTEQKIARRNELKAKSTLLLAIPDEHLLRFHGIKDAKTLWEAIKTRFQKLISQLEIHGEVISQEDANLKLLRSLPPAWNTHTLIMRNKSDLDMLSIDDLYKNLKVYEAEIKGQSNSSLNSQNVAFVSSNNTSNTNEAVNIAHDVFAASSQGQAFASTYDDDAMFSFFANQSNSPQLDNEDLEQIDTDDLEEMDLKCSQLNERDLNNKSDVFESASDSSINESEEDNNQANDRYKAGEGYHAVPPPYTGNFMPLRPDMSFVGLDDSVFKSAISETVTSIHETKTSASKTSKERKYVINNEGKATGQRKVRPVWNNAQRVNHQNFSNNLTHPHPRRSFVPTAIITNLGKVPVNTAKQSSPRAVASTSTPRYVNTVVARPTMNEIDGGFVAFGGSPKGGKISGKGGLTCLFAKATIDESNLWHRILGHINFKTMNKLVMRNLVRVNTACYVQNRVLGTKPHNKTPYELLISRLPNLDFIRPFGCLVTILNTLDHLGKFKGKVDEGFLVGYFVNRRGPEWLFDIDLLTKSMNYEPVTTGNQTNDATGIEINVNAGQPGQEKTSDHEYILLPFMPSHSPLSSSIQSSNDKDADEAPSKGDEGETGIFNDAYDDREVGAKVDINNLELSTVISPIPSTRVHKDHPKEQIIGDLNLATQTRRVINFFEEKAMTLVDLSNGKRAIRTKWVFRNKKDERGIVVRNKARLVAQDGCKECLFVWKIEEEVFVCQPLGFEDPYFPDKVYKVEKALYGLHQAPRAWYETLSTYLLENGFRRGTIDKTLFIKKDKDNILLVQVYVDDIIFGSTKKSLCNEFKQMMHKRFQISSMEELTLFLGLQVKQNDDEIFITQDKYMANILKKFDFTTVKTASTPMEPNKALIKDAEAEDVDVHLYILMIGSLMYLTASRPDIMFAVCTCARDSPFDLEAFSDSDYAGASLDRKSITG
nr:hypothetical protein [Tanacetum cinerariifolium]